MTSLRALVLLRHLGDLGQEQESARRSARAGGGAAGVVSRVCDDDRLPVEYHRIRLQSRTRSHSVLTILGSETRTPVLGKKTSRKPPVGYSSVESEDSGTGSALLDGVQPGAHRVGVA